MDNDDAAGLKARYWQRFCTSLASMRTKEKGDVILECGKDVFYAHKIILEASSSYFQRMFKSGLDESKSGKVYFKEMDTATLDAILDFIYLQQVSKIHTEEQLKNVMMASHLLGLEELFQYCADTLASTSSMDVFMYLFTLSLSYETQNLKQKVMSLWSARAEHLVFDDSFLALTLLQIQELLYFLKSNLLCLDYMLLGILKWAKHDLGQRERFVSALLESIDAELVSKECVRSLFKYPELITLSTDVESKVKEIGLRILLTDNKTEQNDPCPNATEKAFGASMRLVFFCRNRSVQVFYPDQNYSKIALKEHCLCVQQLKLDTMEWLPCQNVDFDFDGASICQHGRMLHMACGKHLNYAVYDLEKNAVAKFEFDVLGGRRDVGICGFKGHIYVVGGYWKTSWTTAVHYYTPGGKEWHEAAPLICADSEPNVLTTSYCIFVLSYNFKTCNISVEFNSDPASGKRWEIMYIHKTGALTCSSFTVLNNTLQAIYIAPDGDVMHLKYDHCKKQLEAKKHPIPPAGCTAVTRVCPGLDNQSFLVCLSKDCKATQRFDEELGVDPGDDRAVNAGKYKDAFYVPNFRWNPESGNWGLLNPPTGLCDGKYALSSGLCVI